MMFMSFLSTLFLLNALLFAQAFVVTVTPKQSPCAVQLNLLPTQGSQLVAAFNAAFSQHDEDDGEVPRIMSPASLSRAQSFVGRVFSLPSSLIQKHPHPKLEGFTQDDAVYYPLVGFTLVTDNTNHIRALPKVPNASCRVRRQDEDIFGWFSPACHLTASHEDVATGTETL